ncbi:MAG: hypothetical protein K8S97_08065, partial [Anaerolineae bacterium]|nr:hypothetical protein [Anaerolineae bacterium]
MKSRRLIILLLLVPLLLGAAPLRQDQPAITLTVAAGYDGFFRPGQWIPLRVTMSNDGDSLDGYLRVRTGELGGLEETTYRTPLDLPRGARKQVFLYISLENFARDAQVEVVNANGRVVARETIRLRQVGRSDVLYAVVTASPYGAVELSTRAPGVGNAHQVNWRVEDIPLLPDALSGLDVMLFHDVDTGLLRAEQVEAIRLWVLTGGHLIVAGGDNWQRTTAQLTDLLPVALAGTVPLESAEAFGHYLRLPTALLAEEMTATSSTLLLGARTLIATDDDMPLLARVAYGGGWVDFLAVDPHAEPLRSWEGRADLWYTLITSVGQSPSWGREFGDWSTAQEGTTTVSGTVLPTFVQLCGFLLAYIMLLGPVNYIVLKRLKRREWAWFTIPALIAVFSVIAYTVGFNLRGTVPVVNRLTVIRAFPEQAEAQVSTLIGVQSPRRREYDIAVEDEHVVRTLPEEGIGLSVPVMINESTRYSAQDILIDGGTIASFVANGYDAAPELTVAAEWILSDVSGVSPRLVGTVTNRTGVVLEDAVIVIKGAAERLGTLPPGEAEAFDIPLGPSNAAPLSLGNGYFNSRRAYNPWQTGGSYAWCFATYSGIQLTLPDVLGNESFSCDPHASGRAQEVRRRYRLLAAYVVDTDPSGGRGDGAYLFAWSKQPQLNVELGGREFKTEDTTLYVFELPVAVAATDGRVVVPASLTTWTILDRD